MLVRIEDENVAYEFRGTRIAGPVSTRLNPRGQQRARWMDAELYRKDDGSGYVFYQVNYSTVWHLAAGLAHVRKPREIPGTGLGPDAVYCGVLPPPRGDREQCPRVSFAEARRMAVPELVIAEEPQYRVWAMPGRDATVRKLTVAQHRSDGSASAAVSAPIRELLAQAAENDPAFRTAIKAVVEM